MPGAQQRPIVYQVGLPAATPANIQAFVTKAGAELSDSVEGKNRPFHMQSQEQVFTELRPVLMKVARRMLGSEAEAEDVVQEAFLKWQGIEPRDVRSPKAYLTSVVTRLSLNHLDLARVRLEHSDAPLVLENLSSSGRSPAEHAELADVLSQAFMTVLGNLSATERAVFLLREAFDLDYSDIASVVDRSEQNCRQILKRARERVAAKEFSAGQNSKQNQRVISEFLNAAETGEIDRLLQVLSDEATLARDPGDLSRPAPPLIRDRQLLLQTLTSSLAEMRNLSDRFALLPVGRDYACVARTGRRARRAILLRLTDKKVAAVRLVTCPALLGQLQILMAVNAGEDFQQESTHNTN